MSKLVCECAQHGLTAHITPRKVVAVGIIITGLSYVLFRALKRKRILEDNDDDEDDVLPAPIQEENGNYPVENEVSWTRVRSFSLVTDDSVEPSENQASSWAEAD